MLACRRGWGLVVVLGVAVGLGGCRRQEGVADSPQVSAVKASLAERERKVQSYRFSGESVHGEERVSYSFAFRAPNKMRGEIAETGVTFAFDGRRLVQWDEKNRFFHVVDMEKAPRAKAQMFLHKVFAPFAPEGWRAPLLGGTLTAEQRVLDGKERTAVTAQASADGESVAITYLFAPPAMDFLGKQVRGGGAVEVLEQHCDEKLGLCFPSVFEETTGVGPKMVTRLTGIEINSAIPPEFFSLEPPEGVEPMVRGLP
jgi:outer membrane lipoprotein-sorting protein